MEGFTFGQKKDKPERLSPNLNPLRTEEVEIRENGSEHDALWTEEAEIREKESEHDAPSDRRSRNPGE
ncbi:hypothetical protein [Cytobacillus oceanisediminis]|uniref:hypothetical protein n=1 Tax=Cytobacillus oceanisediminis TaxID=665099 RepID=UPI002494B826|nr:hypothetical protein [Cytobacillus oceanisediminis]